MVGEERTTRTRDQGRESLDEGERIEQHVRRAVSPRPSELVRYPSIGEEREALGSERRASDVPT